MTAQPSSRYHRDLICHGNNCQLASPKFQQEVIAIAKELAEEAIVKMVFIPQLRNATIGTSLLPAPDCFMYVELLDHFVQCSRGISGGIWFSHPDENFDIDDEGISSLLSIMISQLLQNRKSAPDCDPQTYLLLRLAVSSSTPNCELLEQLLQSCNNKLSPCILSSLLLKACRNGSIAAVQILHRYGVSLEENLRRKDISSHPIVATLFGLCCCFDEIIPFPHLQQTDIDKAKRHIELVVFLVQHYKTKGLDYRPFFAPGLHGSEFSTIWIMFYVTHLTLVDSDVVKMIVEAASGFLNVEANDLQKTPIFQAFLNIFTCLDPQNETADLINVDAVTKMVLDGALPILRAGGRAPCSIFDVCHEYELSHFPFWRYPLLLDMSVESRLPAKSFQRAALPARIEQRSLHAICLRFPRSLQCAARQAILARLPLGVKSRFDAIKALPIPPLLQSFLNFDDFDRSTNVD